MNNITHKAYDLTYYTADGNDYLMIEVHSYKDNKLVKTVEHIIDRNDIKNTSEQAVVLIEDHIRRIIHNQHITPPTRQPPTKPKPPTKPTPGTPSPGGTPASGKVKPQINTTVDAEPYRRVA